MYFKCCVYIFLDELQELEKENFGMLHKVGKSKNDIFLKSSPLQISVSLLNKVNMSNDEYTLKFKSTNGVDRTLLMLGLASHPQHDEIVDWFNV